MSQQIPKGYELESVLDFEEDGRTSIGTVYATSDSKFLIVKDGYKTTTFYVFSTESYKLTNKVTIDKYIPSFFYKNGVFIAKSTRDKKIYTFSAFKNSENGKVIQINKSNELLAGFNFQKFQNKQWLQEISTPYYYKNNMFVWNAARFAYETTISVLKPIKTVIVNNTTIDNLEETETDIKGQYYALIVGINEYEDESIVDLDNPTNDANNFYKVLIENYTFNKENVKILNNATKEEFLQELDNFSNLLNKNDNFTIFYAGHGYWDEKFKEGYWFLSDSYKNKRRSWVSNGQVQEYLRGISSKSTLLIADACFSGSIFKTRSTAINKILVIKELYDLPSRKAMTSGNLSTVADNSVFIKYLIQRLKENNNKFLTSEQLFSSVKTPTINNSINTQIPQYGIINGVGDEGGDFIFIKK
tara:strand:- start:114 stop:1361 length:1248 start_codon:yes stop_codon:yes gene_type:complete